MEEPVKITRSENIEAWKAARELNRIVYETTKAKGFSMDLDLCRQRRRAASSAMSNIAEGVDAGSDPEFRRFLRTARRPTTEMQSHLYVALDQECLVRTAFDKIYEKAASVRRFNGGFIKYLEHETRNAQGLPLPRGWGMPDRGLRTGDWGP
jgi:four helix bundle protein